MSRIQINDDAKDFVGEEAARQNACELTIVRIVLEAYRYLCEVAKRDGKVVLGRADVDLEHLADVLPGM